MKIKVLKNYGSPKGVGLMGEVKHVADDYGEHLVANGIAEEVAEKKVESAPEIETAAAEPEIETADAAPKVKKRKSK